MDSTIKEKNRKEKYMTELRINEVKIPEVISFNYEELKTALLNKVKDYEGLVVTADQIKYAKTDKADLNKLKKALNDERLRLQREYMKPFDEFKKQMDELISIIDRPVALIDKQLKEFEEQEKTQKKADIQELFDHTGFQDFVTLEMIWNPRWLNKSYSFSQIQADLDAKKYQIGSDVFTIHEMPVFSYEAMVVYKETLDLSKALTEGKRLADIQKKKQEELEKQEAEKKVAEQKKVSDEESQQIEFNTIESFDENVLNNLKATQEKDEKREWVAFNAYLTPEDAQALVEFFKNRNISFKPV